MNSQSGFTLIELLVAMAILGILLGVVLALQSATISTGTGVAASGRAMEEQNATMAYIADRFRSSVGRVTPSTLNLGSGVSCDPAAATKTCVAFAVPETDSAGAVARCVVLAYNVEKRTTFTDRRPDAWADANDVMVVREYRSVANTGKCSTSSATPGATWDSAVVGDGFTLTGASGTLKPFELTAPTTTSPANLIITLRSTYPRNGTAKYFPGNADAKLTAVSRN